MYADLIADCNGFEELIRVRIAMATAQAASEIERKVLEGWINLEGEMFEQFVRNVCQWSVEDDGVVRIPVNNDNEAKTTVTRENVKFDRESSWFMGFGGKGSGLMKAKQSSRDWLSEHTSSPRRWWIAREASEGGHVGGGVVVWGAQV